MLEKSRRNAFAMGCVYTLTALVSIATMEALSKAENGITAIFRPYVSNQPLGVRILAWLVFALLILFTGWVMSWFVYARDETHFGPQGALRWAVAGFIYAMWMKSVVQSLSQYDMPVAEVVEKLLGVVGLSISYGIAFGLPRRDNEPRGEVKDGGIEHSQMERAA
jgi:TctA family transporter